MASYEIKEARTKKMDYKGSGKDKIDCTFVKTYDVEVTGIGGESTDAVDVLNAPGIPKPNRTAYISDDGQSVVPFILCRSVNAEQSPQRLSRWKVTTTWQGQYEGSNPTFVGKPTSATDVTPKVTSKIGEIERVIYEDKASVWPDGTTIPKRRYMSPAGSWYDEPLIERIPTLELTIEQYETSITYEAMMNRKFKCNDTTYRSKQTYTWLIEDVQGTEVDLELAGGTASVALVTHTLLYNPRKRRDGKNIGWMEDRILVDTHYLETPNDLTTRKEFADSELQFANMGLIFDTGAKHSNQDGLPDQIAFRPYEIINFQSFLQV